MYRLIWNLIKTLPFKRKTKHYMFLFTTIVIFGLIGLILYYLFGSKVFSDNSINAITFIGYCAVIPGFFIALYMLFKLDQ